MARGATVSVGFKPPKTGEFDALEIDTSGLPSAYRESLPTEVNESVFFSAKCSDGRLLSAMKEYISKAAKGESGYHRDDFIKRMRKALGLRPNEGGTMMEDISSERRLRLIYETQLGKLAGKTAYANALALADVAPFQELRRVERRKEPRDWPSRWRDAGGSFYSGRMVAPLTDKIWTRISRFGLPYPPFDYNSGMGVRSLTAVEGAKLGVPLPRADEAAAEAALPSSVQSADELSSVTAAAGTPAAQKALEDAFSTTLGEATAARLPEGSGSRPTGPTAGGSAEDDEFDAWGTAAVLLAALFGFFGHRVARASSSSPRVAYVGAVGEKVAEAKENAIGSGYFVDGVSPEQIAFAPTVAAGTANAVRSFKNVVFSSSLKTGEAKLAACTVRAPTSVYFNKSSGRYVFTRRFSGDVDCRAYARALTESATLYVDAFRESEKNYTDKAATV